MRLLATRLSATGWNVDLNNLDPDSEAWLASQNITDISVRKRYSDFYTLCKTLTPTLWGRLMMVSLRSNEAPLKTWGGGKSTFPSQLQGNFNSSGVVSFDENGATFSLTASYTSRISTPTGFVYSTHKAEPWFIGMVYRNYPTTGKFKNSTALVNWNIGTTSPFINNYSGGDALIPAWQTGVGLPAVTGGQYVIANNLANNSTNADQLVGFDFQSGRLSVAQLSNNRLGIATHASAAPNTATIGTGLWFLPAFASTAPTGTLKYLVFFSNGITDAPLEASIFWQILRSTLLSTQNHLHFAQGGQSLSSASLQRRIQSNINTTRTVTCDVHSYGGTYISAWLGTDPENPVRASQYLGGFWNPSGTGATQVSWPYGINKNLDKWIIWLQGESDTETRATSLAYKQQLQNLFNFLNEDFEGNFSIAVNLLDYAIAYRTGTLQGNFVLSGITGLGTSANGTWIINSILPIVSGGVVTNANSNYSWTKSGGGTISKNGSNLWEISISGTVYATSVESYTHPELCTWILSNGATGLLEFSESRTGNIERVRKAQADFVSENSSRAVTFDSRGVTRPLDVGLSDAVHPDSAGETELSLRARQQMIGVLPPPVISGFAYPMETLTSTRAGQWYIDNIPVDGQTGATFQIPLLAYGKNITCDDSNILTVWKPSDIAGVSSVFVADRNAFNNSSPETLALNGQTVRRWSGQIGTSPADQTTAINQPVYRSTGQNGYPSVEFDGSNDSLALSGTQLDVFKNVSTGYLIAGCRDTNPSGGAVQHSPISFSINTGAEPRLCLFTHSFAARARRLSAEASAQTPDYTSNSNYNVLTAEALYSSGVLNMRVNASQIGTANFPTSGNTENLASQTAVIGNMGSLARHFPGHIACVIAVNQTLSATNRSRLERFAGLFGNLNIPLV